MMVVKNFVVLIGSGEVEVSKGGRMSAATDLR